MKQQIDEFWKWFIKNEKRFWNYNEENSHDLLAEIQEHLSFITHDDSTVGLEFAEILDSIKRLEISADGVKELFDPIIELVEAAPELSNWEFVAFRQPSPMPFRLEYDEMAFDTAKMFFLPYEDEDGNLNLAIYGENFKQYREKDENAFYHYGLTTIDNVIGEYDCVMRVTSYDFLDVTEIGEEEVYALENLPDFIEDYYSEEENEE